MTYTADQRTLTGVIQRCLLDGETGMDAGDCNRAGWHVADTLFSSGILVDTATILALLPDECWVFRQPHSDASCIMLIGATFDNQAVWAADMCCLPCRIRDALSKRSAR